MAPLQLPPLTFDQQTDLTSLHDLLHDANSGRDITRPRDIYTFLSLGTIPVTSALPRRNLRSRSAHDVRKRRAPPEVDREASFRRKSVGEPAETYVQFDVTDNHQVAPLPSIKSAFDDVIDGVDEDNKQNRGGSDARKSSGDRDLLTKAPASSRFPPLTVSQSEGWNKVDVSTTYIFAPNERLGETLRKYPKAVLPQISSRKGNGRLR